MQVPHGTHDNRRADYPLVFKGYELSNVQTLRAVRIVRSLYPMSGYETAPATVLLATECACCARPLVDSVSVDTGVGPECRKRHGFTRPDLDIDLVNVAATLAAELPADVFAATVKGAPDARTACNRLVHRVAANPSMPATELAAITNAIDELGFVKLAARITKRFASVFIEEVDGGFAVTAPYSEESVAAFRKVPGRRFVKVEGKRGGFNFVPKSSKLSLWNVLRSCYAGQVARGPRGVFTISAA